MFRWASGLSLATEYKMQFHKLTSGSRSLEVLLCMLYVVWRSHHTSWGTFWRSLMNMRMSLGSYLGSPSVVVLCQRHGRWGATGTMLLADGKRPLRYTNNLSEQHST